MELTLNRIKWDSGERCVCRDRKEIQAHRALAWLARDFGKKEQVTDAVLALTLAFFDFPITCFLPRPIRWLNNLGKIWILGGRLSHGYSSAAGLDFSSLAV